MATIGWTVLAGSLAVWCILISPGRASPAIPYLYFHSPGSEELKVGQSVLGGQIDPMDHGKADNLLQTGYRCLSGEFSSFDVQSLSHDADQGRMAMKLREQDELLSVVQFQLCKPLLPCVTQPDAVIFKKVDWRTSDPDVKFEVQSIAYHKGHLYMMGKKEAPIKRSQPDDKVQSLILKKFLQSCQDDLPFGSEGNTFSPEKCTSTLTVVKENVPEETEQLTLYNSLVTLEQKGRNVHFLTVLLSRNKEMDPQYTAKLIFMDSANKSKELHSHAIPPVFLTRRTGNLGGISVRQGKVCWTAVNAAYCGDWDSDKQVLNNIQLYIEDGAADVCTGDAVSKRLLTGIAITSSTDEFSFYFGCQSMSHGFGGAGMVVVPPGGTVDDAQVHKVTSNGTDILAGQMFLTDHCGEHSHYEVHDPGAAESTSQGHVVTLTYSTTVFCLFALFSLFQRY